MDWLLGDLRALCGYFFPLSPFETQAERTAYCQITTLGGRNRITAVCIPLQKFVFFFHIWRSSVTQPDYPQILDASDHSVLVRFGTEIDLVLHQSVRRLTRLLSSDKTGWFINLHPAYASLLITYDPRATSPDEVRRRLSHQLEGLQSVELPKVKELVIPVLYGEEYGPDLADVASRNGISPEDVVERHSSGRYLVYFLGFSPGFAYMGGLAASLATPRLAIPRTHVPAGSVAIGGKQTGIYPIDSPGGWRIIGRTPLELFNPHQNPPALLQSGDEVRFRKISIEEFRAMRTPGDTLPRDKTPNRA